MPKFPSEKRSRETLVEFTSSGCGAVVSKRAFSSRYSELFEVPLIDKIAVAPLEPEYADEEQRQTAESLVEMTGATRWDALGCRIW